jgi:Carboxypeptidase regulatory-like domain
MKLAIVMLAAVGLLSAQTASIEGTVVNQKTGEGLSGVHVRMITGNFNSAAEVYGAMTDKAGHFSAANLKPGFYMILAEKAGFLPEPPEEGQSPLQSLSLKAGEHKTDFKIPMNARAVLAGRVVNEDGDPVQNVRVQLEAPQSSGRAANVFGVVSIGTDDLGEFRLITMPGKYYIQAGMQSGPPDTREIRTDGTQPRTYSSTYYPSATDKSGAVLVEARAGDDVTGLEIRLSGGAAGRVLSISGNVWGAEAEARPTVTLSRGDDPNHMTSGQTARAGADGKFSFQGLGPGYYRLYASVAWNNKEMLSDAVDVHLTGSDETVRLILTPGGELAGTLAVVGEKASAGLPGKVTVRLDPVEPQPFVAFGVSPEAVGKDGAFHLANLHAGRFKLVVEPLPASAYVQSVTLDGAVLPDDVLDFSNGVRGSRIKVTIGLDSAEVSGKILDKDGDPNQSPMIMVILAADSKHVFPPTKIDRGDGGNYSIKAIRPGKYRILAVDLGKVRLLDGSNQLSPEDSAKLFEAGEEIELKPGDRAVKSLKAIDELPGKDAAHAAKN